MSTTATICPGSKSAILESQLDTPVGVLAVKACGHGLHSISYPHKQKDSDLKQAVTGADTNTSEGETCLAWLRSYFSNEKGPAEGDKSKTKVPTFCFPPDESTEFERQVWMTLFEKTKIGDTLSYGELAKLIGNPKAARAVGTALKKNPIPIIIPCHRVTRANGDIGNYNGGSNIKEFLLQHEQAGHIET